MTQSTLRKKSHVVRNLSWISYSLLLLLMVVTSLPAFLPENSSVTVILVVKLLPLLIVLPGMLKDKLRPYIWLCFIVLFYFTQSVVETFLSKGGGLDLIITILTVVLFISAMMHVKWERQLGKPL